MLSLSRPLMCRSRRPALDGSGGHLGQLQEVRFLLCGSSCPSLIALPVNGADSGGRSVLRQKTQARGRSNRAITARPMMFSALGAEPRGDRVTVIAGHVAHVPAALLVAFARPNLRKAFSLKKRAPRAQRPRLVA